MQDLQLTQFKVLKLVFSLLRAYCSNIYIVVVLVEVQSQALLPDDVDVDDHVGVAVVVAAAAAVGAAAVVGAAGAVAGQTRLFLHSVETGCFFYLVRRRFHQFLIIFGDSKFIYLYFSEYF